MTKGFFSHIEPCNFCGKSDVVFPVSGLHLCPRCMKGGHWEPKDVVLIGSGICDICGTYFVGADKKPGGIYVKQAKACWACEWRKLGKHKNRFSVGGTRFA
jgi:hypothetical protein